MMMSKTSSLSGILVACIIDIGPLTILVFLKLAHGCSFADAHCREPINFCLSSSF